MTHKATSLPGESEQLPNILCSTITGLYAVGCKLYDAKDNVQPFNPIKPADMSNFTVL